VSVAELRRRRDEAWRRLLEAIGVLLDELRRSG